MGDGVVAAGESGDESRALQIVATFQLIGRIRKNVGASRWWCLPVPLAEQARRRSSSATEGKKVGHGGSDPLAAVEVTHLERTRRLGKQGLLE